jgi:hypothetical protein
MESENDDILNYMLEYFHDHYVKKLSDADLKQFYEANPDLYRRPFYFKLQTIVTNTRGEAVRAFNEAIIDPANFDDMVVKYSNDPNAKFNKGRSAYQEKEQLGKRYDTLVRRRAGDIVRPIEAEPGVWHVYKIEEKVQGARIPFDEVKAQISSKVIFDMMQNYIEEIIRRYNLYIRKFPENLKIVEEPRNEQLFERFFRRQEKGL